MSKYSSDYEQRGYSEGYNPTNSDFLETINVSKRFFIDKIAPSILFLTIIVSLTGISLGSTTLDGIEYDNLANLKPDDLSDDVLYPFVDQDLDKNGLSSTYYGEPDKFLYNNESNFTFTKNEVQQCGFATKLDGVNESKDVCKSIDSSLDYYYTFDNDNILEPINNLQGTVLGSPTVSSGKVSYSYDFDGDDDTINLGKPGVENYTSYTISTWFKTSESGESGTLKGIVTKEDSAYFLQISPDSSLDTAVHTYDGVSTSFAVNDGSWHHAVARGTGNKIELWVDGEKIGQKSVSYSIPDSSFDLTVGSRQGQFGDYFNGKIDDLRIYDSAISVPSDDSCDPGDSSKLCEIYLSTNGSINPTIDFVSSPNVDINSPVNDSTVTNPLNVNYSTVGYSDSLSLLELKVNSSFGLDGVSLSNSRNIAGDSSYEGFPDCSRAKNGTVICVYRDGTAHNKDDDSSVIKGVRSYDNGSTWTSSEVIVDETGYDLRNPTLNPVTENGSLVLSVVYEDFSSNRFPVRLFSSYDNGETFENKRKVSVPGIDIERWSSDWVVNDDGSIYAPGFQGEDGDTGENNIHYIIESNDNGETFSLKSQVTEQSNIGNEWAITNPYGDYWIAALRGSPTENSTLAYKSFDGANSWKGPYNWTNKVGAVADPIFEKVSSGNIILSSRIYTDSGVSTRIQYSDDAGRNWKNQTDFYTSIGSDSGYTDIVRWNKTNGLLVNYQEVDGQSDTDIFAYDTRIFYKDAFNIVKSNQSSLVNNSNQNISFDFAENNFDLPSNFDYRVKLFQSDSQSDFDQGSVEVLPQDSTPPSVTIHSPLNQTYSSSSVDLDVSANETVDVWEYSLDGSANQTFTPNSSFSGLSDGGHTLNVFANDSSGNTGSESVSFTVDTTDSTPPTSSDNWTLTGFVDKSSADVELTASDSGSGVANISYRVNGGSYTTDTGSSTTVTVSTDGNNTLEYFATDNDGNVESTNIEYVALDSKVVWENFSFTPLGDGIKQDSKVAFSSKFKDDLTGLDKVRFAVKDNGTWNNLTGDFEIAYRDRDLDQSEILKLYETNGTNTSLTTLDQDPDIGPIFDFDQDGEKEQVFSGNYLLHSSSFPGFENTSISVAGFGGSGDFDSDGLPEVVTEKNGEIVAIDYNGQITNTGITQFDDIGGIADWDGDSNQEIMFIGQDDFVVGVDSEGSITNTSECCADSISKEVASDSITSHKLFWSSSTQIFFLENNANSDDLGSLVPSVGNGLGGVGDWDGDNLQEVAAREISGQAGVPNTNNLVLIDEERGYQNISIDVDVDGLGGIGNLDSDGPYRNYNELKGTFEQVNYTYSLSKVKDSASFRYWVRDSVGNWNNTDTETISFPSFKSSRIVWDDSRRKVFYNYSSQRDVDSVSNPPSGTLTSTSTSAVVSSWSSPFDWTASVTDVNSVKGAERNINFTKNTIYDKVENASGVVNETQQTVNTTLELDVRGEPSNITLDTANPNNLISTVKDGRIDTTTAVTGIQRGEWYWTVDSINTQLFGEQPVSGRNHKLSTQYIERNKEIQNIGSTDFTRLEVEAASITGTTLNKSTVETGIDSGNKKNLSFQSKIDQLQAESFNASPTSETVNIALDFSAERNISINNTFGQKFNGVETSEKVFTNQGCTLESSTKKDVATGKQNYSYSYSCDTGEVGPADISQELNADADNDTHYFYNTSEFNISTNLSQDSVVEWEIAESELNDWDDKKTSGKVYYNGQVNDNISIVDGIGTVTLRFGTDCCGSSPSKGSHDVSLFYETGEGDTTIIENGGGGGGGTDPGDDEQTIHFGLEETAAGEESFTVPFGETATRNLSIVNERQAATTVRISRGNQAFCNFVSVETSLGSGDYGASGEYSVPAATQTLGTVETSVDTRLRFDVPNSSVIDSRDIDDLSCEMSTSSSLGTAEPLVLEVDEEIGIVTLLKDFFEPLYFEFYTFDFSTTDVDSTDPEMDSSLTLNTYNVGLVVLVLGGIWFARRRL